MKIIDDYNTVVTDDDDTLKNMNYFCSLEERGRGNRRSHVPRNMKTPERVQLKFCGF